MAYENIDIDRLMKENEALKEKLKEKREKKKIKFKLNKKFIIFLVVSLPVLLVTLALIGFMFIDWKICLSVLILDAAAIITGGIYYDATRLDPLVREKASRYR